MSDKIVVEEEGKLIDTQIDTAEEIKEHIIKAMSVLDLITSSLEKKEDETKDLDIASELNAMVSIYDNLDCAFHDAHELQEFLKQQASTDAQN